MAVNRVPKNPKYWRGERRDQNAFKTPRLVDSGLVAYHVRRASRLSTNENASGEEVLCLARELVLEKWKENVCVYFLSVLEIRP